MLRKDLGATPFTYRSDKTLRADSLLRSYQGSPSKGPGYREVRSRDKAADCELGALYRLPAKYQGRSQSASQPQIHADNKSEYVASVDAEETNNKLASEYRTCSSV
ncbi:unnamed protein product [Rangifer tarandus platyrhynchus]|uniref:Uncharacterized protein n=1 Tax=Rangifer tarandus platyrhynchus TaxID=3082113 RepID=A0AC60A9N4_RANTA